MHWLLDFRCGTVPNSSCRWMSYWQCLPQWLLLWRDSGGLFSSRAQRNPQGHPNVHHRPVSSACCMNHLCFSFHIEHKNERTAGWVNKMNEYLVKWTIKVMTGLMKRKLMNSRQKNVSGLIVMACHKENDVQSSRWTRLHPLFPMCPKLVRILLHV